MNSCWAPRFGEAVRNTCASQDNPRRDGYFVRKVVRTGVLNRGSFYEVTDGSGHFWLLPVAVVAKAPIKEQVETQPAADGVPLAWMRAWAYRGETPHKERKENGRMAWPLRFKLLAITQNKMLPDDIPLYTAHSTNSET